jgi:hypothetical protein
LNGHVHDHDKEASSRLGKKRNIKKIGEKTRHAGNTNVKTVDEN